MDTDDHELGPALADLAATAGWAPLPMGEIRSRARRLRRRRRARTAIVSTAGAAALVVGLTVAASHRQGASAVSTAGPPPAVLPLCTAAGAATAAPGPAAAGSRTTTSTTGPGSASTTPVPAIGERFKAPGTVAAAPAASTVTILVGAPLHQAVQPVVFAVTGETQVSSEGQPATVAVLRPGLRVGLVATRTGADAFRLEAVQTIPTGQPAAKVAAAQAAQRAAEGSGAPAVGQAVTAVGQVVTAVGQVVNGKGSLVSVSSTTVRIVVGGGPLGGRTVDFSVTAATRFLAGSQECDPTGLAGATPAAFSATAMAGGAFRLDQLQVA